MTRRELTTEPNLSLLLLKAVVGGIGKKGGELPDDEFIRTAVTVDPVKVADYSRVCGYTLRDQLPPLYPHVLAFPLSMRLMAQRSFPFPLPGLVHVANTATITRPVDSSEPITLRVTARDLRPHRKGRQFDMVTTASVGAETVWTGTSTYLRRGAGADPEAEDTLEVTVGEPSALWSVPADTGRRYAEVSGDRNPIHLNPLTARLFGFPTAIAHGMWTKARALAAFEGRLPAAYTVDVRFRQPILLPAKVSFARTAREDGYDFQVTGKKGRPHLDGMIRAL